jgi:hypothetical protein
MRKQFNVKAWHARGGVAFPAEESLMICTFCVAIAVAQVQYTRAEVLETMAAMSGADAATQRRCYEEAFTELEAVHREVLALNKKQESHRQSKWAFHQFIRYLPALMTPPFFPLHPSQLRTPVSSRSQKKRK